MGNCPSLLDSSSRRTVATKRSAIPSCQGQRNAVRRGSMPIDRITEITSVLKVAARSKNRCLGAVSKGKASRSCWITQAAVGLAVTPNRARLRRPCRITKRTWRTRKVAVGTVKMSMAAMP